MVHRASAEPKWSGRLRALGWDESEAGVQSWTQGGKTEAKVGKQRKRGFHMPEFASVGENGVWVGNGPMAGLDWPTSCAC